MDSNLAEQRLHAHELLEMLPPERLNVVSSLLEVMVPGRRNRRRD